MAKAKKMTALRKAARGQECTIRLYPYCNGDPDTSVLCHAPCDDDGMGYKSPDHWAAIGCSSCHSIIDGGWVHTELSKGEVDRAFTDAIYRTQKYFISLGLITVRGAA